MKRLDYVMMLLFFRTVLFCYGITELSYINISNSSVLFIVMVT